MHWQKRSPKADELLQIKKHIKSLRSQLRWKLVEVGCMEEVTSLTSLSLFLDLFRMHILYSVIVS